MSPSIGRAYHSMVGWKDENTEDTTLSIHGGMVDNHEISYVYHDTIITSSSAVWLLAEYFSTTHEYLPLVMEHTTVLSEQFGNMFIFGGDVDGVWRILRVIRAQSNSFQRKMKMVVVDSLTACIEM